MASIEIVLSSGKCYCRGYGKNCAFTNGKISKGAKALKISIYASGGVATSFYYHKCMILLLEMAKEAIRNAED